MLVSYLFRLAIKKKHGTLVSLGIPCFAFVLIFYLIFFIIIINTENFRALWALKFKHLQWALLGLLHSRFDLYCDRSGYSQNLSSPLRQSPSTPCHLGNFSQSLRAELKSSFTNKKQNEPTFNLILFRNMSVMKFSNSILLNHSYDDLPYVHTYTLSLIHSYTLINSTHSSSLLYSTYLPPPNPIKLFLISIFTGSSSPTSCYRVILCPDKPYQSFRVLLVFEMLKKTNTN